MAPNCDGEDDAADAEDDGIGCEGAAGKVPGATSDAGRDMDADGNGWVGIEGCEGSC